MFGKLTDYTQNGQQITLHYEKQDVILHVLTSQIINVFVPYAHKDHRSKAIEGNKEQTTEYSLTDSGEGLTLKTADIICKIDKDGNLDFYDKEENLLCADYRGQRIPRFQLQESYIEFIKQEGHQLDADGLKNYKVQCIKKLDEGDCIYGLGDKTGVLNKRYY